MVVGSNFFPHHLTSVTYKGIIVSVQKKDIVI